MGGPFAAQADWATMYRTELGMQVASGSRVMAKIVGVTSDHWSGYAADYGRYLRSSRRRALRRSRRNQAGRRARRHGRPRGR